MAIVKYSNLFWFGATLVLSLTYITSIKASITSNKMSNFASNKKSKSNDEGEKSTPAWPQTGNPNVLVAGGAGYIGTHTIVSLLSSGYDVTIVDNLCNSNKEAIERVKTITKCDSERIRFYDIDLCDKDDLKKVFTTSGTFDSCIHFAGLKAVGESVREPILYYNNNLISTLNLIELLDEYNCHSLVFSSSATVYGASDVMPITEDTQAGVGITNAYGRTKYMIEEILKDFKGSKKVKYPDGNGDDWSIVVLRYFSIK